MKTYKTQFDHVTKREPESLLRFIAQTIVCLAVGVLIFSLFLPALTPITE